MQASHKKIETHQPPSLATEVHSKVELVGHPHGPMHACSNNAPPVQNSAPEIARLGGYIRMKTDSFKLFAWDRLNQ